MKVTRRSFIAKTSIAGASLAASAGLPMLPLSKSSPGSDLQLQEGVWQPPAFAIIPVVGDGKWIWTEPPKDGSKGYLEPREFEVTTGINFRGEGYASEVRATTVAPLQFPEQEVVDFKIETSGCEAQLLSLIHI